MLEIFDNKISNINEIYHELTRLPYYYGDRDAPEYDPTGMTSTLSTDSITYTSILNFLSKCDPLKDKTIVRAYVNLFIPKENANFHVDGDEGMTLLYYANPDFDFNEGGETKFLSNNNTLLSVLPVPGRVVVFPAEFQHTASSFKNKHRFTVAFKFK